MMMRAWFAALRSASNGYADGADAIILGRRQEVISRAAATLEKETGRRCIGVSADVRKPESLQAAVAKGVEAFGGIDYVICAAAGNFLSPIEGTSPNGFKTVIDIGAYLVHYRYRTEPV
jgi:peroxisomal 2,4-dienoyl-CoA reductase